MKITETVSPILTGEGKWGFPFPLGEKKKKKTLILHSRNVTHHSWFPFPVFLCIKMELSAQVGPVPELYAPRESSCRKEGKHKLLSGSTQKFRSALSSQIMGADGAPRIIHKCQEAEKSAEKNYWVEAWSLNNNPLDMRHPDSPANLRKYTDTWENEQDIVTNSSILSTLPGFLEPLTIPCQLETLGTLK